jgi:hypothetical protein
MKKKLRILKTKNTFILGSLQLTIEEAIEVLRTDKELEVAPEGLPKIIKFLLDKDTFDIQKIYKIIRQGSIFDYIQNLEKQRFGN